MKPKKTNWFMLFLKISIVCFFIVYFLLENGYYENKKARQVALTEENIRKFEEDVKQNKIIDISNYKIEEEKDYSNKISKLGQSLTDKAGKFIIKGTEGVLDILKSLLW